MPFLDFRQTCSILHLRRPLEADSGGWPRTRFFPRFSASSISIAFASEAAHNKVVIHAHVWLSGSGRCMARMARTHARRYAVRAPCRFAKTSEVSARASLSACVRACH
eukprot:6185164-Pleurochrysis_carterae.AAC.1